MRTCLASWSLQRRIAAWQVRYRHCFLRPTFSQRRCAQAGSVEAAPAAAMFSRTRRSWRPAVVSGSARTSWARCCNRRDDMLMKRYLLAGAFLVFATTAGAAPITVGEGHVAPGREFLRRCDRHLYPWIRGRSIRQPGVRRSAGRSRRSGLQRGHRRGVAGELRRGNASVCRSGRPFQRQLPSRPQGTRRPTCTSWSCRNQRRVVLRRDLTGRHHVARAGGAGFRPANQHRHRHASGCGPGRPVLLCQTP